MTDEELWAAIIAHNQKVRADHLHGLKLDEIRQLADALVSRPKLGEMLEFLRRVREILGEVRK